MTEELSLITPETAAIPNAVFDIGTPHECPAEGNDYTTLRASSVPARAGMTESASNFVSFLRVFAPLRELIPALVAALPRWARRGEIGYLLRGELTPLPWHESSHAP